MTEAPYAEPLVGDIWVLKQPSDDQVAVRVEGLGHLYHTAYVDWTRTRRDSALSGGWDVWGGPVVRDTRERFVADFQLLERPSKDLTAQFHTFRKAQQAERVAFPWHNMSHHPGARLMQEVARDLLPHIRHAANMRHGGHLDDEAFKHLETMKLGGEAGEALEAYNRWLGVARRHGTREEYLAELADVVIGAYINAELAESDLSAAIEAKLRVIYDRGWSEDGAAPAHRGEGRC